MQITITGSGTSQGVPVIGCDCKVCKSKDKRDKRLRCSVHIYYKGKSIVIDTGPDFRQQMLDNDVKSLDAILFTHEHKDHVAGLDDVRPFNFSQKKSLARSWLTTFKGNVSYFKLALAYVIIVEIM